MSTPPIPYNRQSDFTMFSTEQFPTVGQDLEAEFNAIDQSVDQTQDRLAQIQRDDGLLKNLSVHPDALGEAVRALLGADAGTPKGNWQTGLIYNPKDVVMFDGVSYLAAAEHFAGADFAADLAAGKWLPLSGANDGGSLRTDLASSAAGKGAAMVQYDVDETVKQRLDALGNLRADLANPGTGTGADLVRYNVGETVGDHLDNLAAAGGSALIGFQQAGAGASVRDAQAKARERISVKDFGAVGDGVTDDTDAIKASIAYAESIAMDDGFHINAQLYFPHGWYVINDTLTISTPLAVLGEGIGDAPTNNAPGTGGAMTMILAGAGMTDKPVVRVVAGTHGQVLIHGSFERIQINGQGRASYGFYGSSLSRWKLDVSEFRCRLAGMRLDDANGTLNSFNEIRNSYVAGVDGSTIGSHGLWIIGTQGTSAGNPQQRIFMASAFTVNGDNLRFESDVDNAIVYYSAGIVTGTGRNLALVNGAGTPRVNFFLYLAGGRIFFDSNTFANVIYATSSETTTITGTGQYHLTGIVDYATGGMWRTNSYLLTDELLFSPSDFQVSAAGAGAAVSNLASFLPCWTLDPAGYETIATSRHLPQHWRNAHITQARINFSFEADPGAGTSVVFRVYVQASSPQAGQIVGVPTTKDLTFALPSNNIRRNFEAIVTLDAPLTVPNDAMIVFAIQRLGSNGADTAATDVYVTGASLMMQSLGPTSAGSGTITIPPMSA